MPSRWRLLGRLGAAFDPGGVTPEEQAAWVAQRRAVMVDAFPLIALIFVVAPILWWPTDPWVFAEYPRAVEAMTWMRSGACLVAGTLFVTLRWSAWVRQHVMVLGVAGALLVGTVAGASMAHAGDLDGPWVHFLYVVPLVTLGLIADLLPRLLITLGLGLSTVGGYFVAEPRWAEHPLLLATVSYSVFSVLFCTAIGHGVMLLMRTSYIRSLRLTSLAASLEQRVDEKTAELRALARRLEVLREEERKWMAREVHDELGQELAALQFTLSYARGRVEQGAEPGLRALDEVDSVLKRTRETVRRMVRSLRPPVLDERGAVAAVEWLVKDMGERAGLTVHYSCDGDAPTLMGDHATAVFRVAQELVTNAVRHGAGSLLAVRLHLTPERLELRVENDGRSLPGGPTGGTGMIGVRERLAAVGGTVRWRAREGGGVVAVVTLPTA